MRAVFSVNIRGNVKYNGVNLFDFISRKTIHKNGPIYQTLERIVKIYVEW